MKHPWELAYDTGSFSIQTQAPSVMVTLHQNNFHVGDSVLDIGCGNGRNSYFFASKGIYVDCFDVADLGWMSNVPENIKSYITFSTSTIENWKWKKNHYKGVILARVIQYVSDTELQTLFQNIHDSLTEDAVVLISYSTSGGIHERNEIKVPKYIHPLKTVEASLRKLFQNVEITQGSASSVHVNYSGALESYDIIAYK